MWKDHCFISLYYYCIFVVDHLKMNHIIVKMELFLSIGLKSGSNPLCSSDFQSLDSSDIYSRHALLYTTLPVAISTHQMAICRQTMDADAPVLQQHGLDWNQPFLKRLCFTLYIYSLLMSQSYYMYIYAYEYTTIIQNILYK